MVLNLSLLLLIGLRVFGLEFVIVGEKRGKEGSFIYFNFVVFFWFRGLGKKGVRKE